MAIPGLQELDALHANMCQAVGDPKRIQIMYALHERPRHVTALAEDLGLPQPTVSRHLGILKQRGVVIGERDGAAVIYSLVDDRIITVLDTMRQILRDVVEAQKDALNL